MSEKKNAMPQRSTVKHGTNQKTIENVSPECDFVKPDYDKFKKYSESLYNGRTLQPFAQKLIRELYPHRDNINYCKCNRVPLGEVVQIKYNNDLHRAHFSGVVTCGNPMLCPVCSPRIMGGRSSEISTVVHKHLAADPNNTCCLLTFTFQHTRDYSLEYSLSNMKLALKKFWSNRKVKQIFRNRVGRITALEINYSLSSGWHPHEHILIFCEKLSDLNKLQKILSECWIAALKECGLSGLRGIALDLIEARSCDKYLQKISSELALSNCKQGRGSGSFTPFQLLAEYAAGNKWAGEKFKELYKTVSSMRVHPLQWSKGLKKHFGIGEVSDQDIVEDKDPSENLVVWCNLKSSFFRKMSPQDQFMLLVYAALGDRDRFNQYLLTINDRSSPD